MKRSGSVNQFIILSIALSLCIACGERTQTGQGHNVAGTDSEVRAKAYQRQEFISASVVPDRETQVVASADSTLGEDLALWYSAQSPSESLLFVAGSKGISVYDLQGNEIAMHPVGAVTALDILQKFPLTGDTVSLVGYTGRKARPFALARIHLNGQLTEIDIQIGPGAAPAMLGMRRFCFYTGSAPYLFAGGEDGIVAQFEMIEADEGNIHIRQVRQLEIRSPVAGMVADHGHGLLYVLAAGQGILRIPAEPNAEAAMKLLELSNERNPNIVFDLKGLTIYERGDYGYLIAGSQGNFSFAVFDRTGGNRYIGSFKITGSDSLDGVEHSQSMDVLSLSLGEVFPHGVFAVHDGMNAFGDPPVSQNVKLVGWEKIEVVMSQVNQTQ